MMRDAEHSRSWRLDLRSATLLDGYDLPHSLRIDRRGEVVFAAGDSSPGIDAGDLLILPALVNSHDHLEFNLYPRLGEPPYADVDEWSKDVHARYADTIRTVESVPLELRWYWGLLKNLNWGVTAVMHHGDNGPPNDRALPRVIGPYRHVHRADRPWAHYRARSLRGQGPLVFHVAEGISAKVARRSSRFLRRSHKHGPLVGVHGILLNAADAEYLDALVWCPASNDFLFGRTANIAALKNSAPVLFGTDASISAQGSIWDHARLARSNGGLDDVELMQSLTSAAAEFWGLDMSADLVIARRRHDDPLEATFAVAPRDILAVVSRHRLLLADPDFLAYAGIDLDRDSYRAVEIDGDSRLLYCAQSDLLERLAAIAVAPVLTGRRR